MFGDNQISFDEVLSQLRFVPLLRFPLPFSSSSSLGLSSGAA